MFKESEEVILEQLVDISRRAGDAILEWYEGDMGITQKADDSPLTKADLASHKLERFLLAGRKKQRAFRAKGLLQ